VRVAGLIISGTEVASIFAYSEGNSTMALVGLILGIFGGLLITLAPIILDCARESGDITLSEVIERLQAQLNGEMSGMSPLTRECLALAIAASPGGDVRAALRSILSSQTQETLKKSLSELRKRFLKRTIHSLARGIQPTEDKLATLRRHLLAGLRSATELHPGSTNPNFDERRVQEAVEAFIIAANIYADMRSARSHYHQTGESPEPGGGSAGESSGTTGRAATRSARA
jgi:hypothetical protein